MTALDSPGFYADADGEVVFISSCTCLWAPDTGQLLGCCDSHRPFADGALDANEVLEAIQRWAIVNAEARMAAAA